MTAWIELKNLAPIYWRLVSVLSNNFEYITTASRIHYNTLSWLMSCTIVAVIVLLRVVGHFRIIYFSVLTSHRMTAKLFSVSKSFLDVSDKKKLSQKCLCSTLGFSRVGSLWIWGRRFLFCQGKLVQVASHHNQVKSSIPMMIKQSKSMEL
jgi:hypothetical protein